MSLQTLLSVLASSCGFVSAFWFGAGALLISPSKIVTASDDSWDAEPGTDKILVSQSAEYFAGGLLLAASFLLQVAAVQVSTATLQWNCPILQSGWSVALIGVLASVALSYPVFLLRRKILWQLVRKIKELKVS